VPAQGDAVAFKRFADDLRGIGIFPGQDAVLGCHQHDFGAEPGEGLRHLAPDGSRADYAQASRSIRQRENGFIGEKLDFIQAGNRRHGGARSGRDDTPAEFQRLTGDFDPVRTCECALAKKNVHSEFTEPSSGIVCADPGPQAPHARHYGREIDGRLSADAEFRCSPHGSSTPRRAKQPF
jgi:hypothetical protein